MLYLAIPAHNEAATIGVLLWRLRTVLAEFPREYEAVVYDDASSDSTSEILESYARVMPLTVLRGERRIGYAGAVDALIRHVVRDTRYPRRDAMLLLQGDFTDSPSLVPEFVKRFEGGTDVVVGERGNNVRRKAPTPVRRLMRAEPWLLRFLVRADGIRDLTSSYRLVRISVLRDLMRASGDNAMLAGDSRTANADLTMRLVPLARRVETLPVEPTWDVRLRETRVVAMADGMNLLRWAWKARGQRAVPSTAPEPREENAPRHSRGRGDREGRPDLRLESRGDWGADNPTAQADNTRHNRNRDANSRDGSAREGRETRTRDAQRDGQRDTQREAPRDRKAKQKIEGRIESRNEPRVESRGEARTEARAERNDSRETTELRDNSVELESVGLSADGEAPAREKRPRRKRSRRGGRNREGAAGNGEEGALDPSAELSENGAADSEAPRAARPVESTRRPAIESDDADSADEPREVELSASLSDAVEDAESELDGESGQRPRRKRRRRGSRSGKRNREGNGDAGDSDSADGAVEASEGELGAESAADDASSDEGEGAPRRSRRGGRRRTRNDADVADGADGASPAESGADSGEEEGGDFSDDESEGQSAEGRTRRRGRRGRRGGSRRSRRHREGDGADGESAGGDSGGESGGGSDREPGPASSGPAD